MLALSRFNTEAWDKAAACCRTTRSAGQPLAAVRLRPPIVPGRAAKPRRCCPGARQQGDSAELRVLLGGLRPAGGAQAAGTSRRPAARHASARAPPIARRGSRGRPLLTPAGWTAAEQAPRGHGRDPSRCGALLLARIHSGRKNVAGAPWEPRPGPCARSQLRGGAERPGRRRCSRPISRCAALAVLEALTRLYPTVAGYHYQQGTALLRAGDPAGAAVALREAAAARARPAHDPDRPGGAPSTSAGSTPRPSPSCSGP